MPLNDKKKLVLGVFQNQNERPVLLPIVRLPSN